MDECCLLSIFEHELILSLKFNVFLRKSEYDERKKKLTKKMTCMESLVTNRIQFNESKNQVLSLFFLIIVNMYSIWRRD